MAASVGHKLQRGDLIDVALLVGDRGGADCPWHASATPSRGPSSALQLHLEVARGAPVGCIMGQRATHFRASFCKFWCPGGARSLITIGKEARLRLLAHQLFALGRSGIRVGGSYGALRLLWGASRWWNYLLRRRRCIVECCGPMCFHFLYFDD